MGGLAPLRECADLDLAQVATPAFVVDATRLRENVALLAEVGRRSGAHVLAALKAFSCPHVLQHVTGPLQGYCASSPHEARLGREALTKHKPDGHVHTFAAAYSDADMDELVTTSDHIVFNSLAQWHRHGPRVAQANAEASSEAPAGTPAISCGLRINPEHSEGALPIYDPCSPGSRLGIRAAEFDAHGGVAGFDLRHPNADIAIEGLHFHTLCEQDADALARTLAAVEATFGPLMHRMRWINFGGGHHITRPGYDVEQLVECIVHVRKTYGVEVFIEPGEAVALNAGVLVATVLDVKQTSLGPVAILDASAATHMPDVIEMPYTPPLRDNGPTDDNGHWPQADQPDDEALAMAALVPPVLPAGIPDGTPHIPGARTDKPYICRLAGHTCLAGDVIGTYALSRPLTVGDRVVFGDMAIYSMVKTNTFNGVGLPSIGVYDPSASPAYRVVNTFGYADFKERL